MSASSGVAPTDAGPGDGDVAGGAGGGPLRVRPPRPLPRWAVVVAVAALVGAVVLVALTVHGDGADPPGSDWRGMPRPPRSGRLDSFAGAGALRLERSGADELAWRRTGGAWARRDGFALASGATPTVATTDAGSADVLVYARVVGAAPGGGVLLSSSVDGSSALAVVAATDAWRVVQRTSAGDVDLATITARVEGVVVQAVRLGSRLSVTVTSSKEGDRVARVDLVTEGPGRAPDGTHVGLTSGGAGADPGAPPTGIDLFGYLPLRSG